MEGVKLGFADGIAFHDGAEIEASRSGQGWRGCAGYVRVIFTMSRVMSTQSQFSRQSFLDFYRLQSLALLLQLHEETPFQGFDVDDPLLQLRVASSPKVVFQITGEITGNVHEIGFLRARGRGKINNCNQ